MGVCGIGVHLLGARGDGAQCLWTWRRHPSLGGSPLDGAQCCQARVCQWPEPLGWLDRRWGELDIPRPSGPPEGLPVPAGGSAPGSLCFGEVRFKSQGSHEAEKVSQWLSDLHTDLTLSPGPARPVASSAGPSAGWLPWLTKAGPHTA